MLSRLREPIAFSAFSPLKINSSLHNTVVIAACGGCLYRSSPPFFHLASPDLGGSWAPSVWGPMLLQARSGLLSADHNHNQTTSPKDSGCVKQVTASLSLFFHEPANHKVAEYVVQSSLPNPTKRGEPSHHQPHHAVASHPSTGYLVPPGRLQAAPQLEHGGVVDEGEEAQGFVRTWRTKGLDHEEQLQGKPLEMELAALVVITALQNAQVEDQKMSGGSVGWIHKTLWRFVKSSGIN